MVSRQKFNRSSPHRARAVQAWQILVGVAMRRQTITYAELAEAMYRRKAQGVLDKILAHVSHCCSDRELPELTAIVVGTGRGTPGRSSPVDLKNVDKERERVYDCDWYDVYPPSAQELHESFKLERSRSDHGVGDPPSQIG